MSDYLDLDDSNLEDIEEETPPVDEEEETEEEEDEQITTTTTTTTIPSSNRNLANRQKKVLSREDIYRQLYNYDQYRTTNMLTKYERARLLGFRAQMIANGAPTLVDTGDLRSPIAKAEKELAEGKLPFVIDRMLPSKNLKKPVHEYRRVAELNL